MSNIYVSKMMIILILLSLGCNRKEKSGEGRKLEGVISVEGYVIKASPLENKIIIPGTILPNERTEIRTELSGRIEELNFTEGTYVTRGTLLMKVDDSELVAQLQKLEAQIEQAKSDEVRKKQLIEVNGITQEEYDLAATKVRELDADIKLIRTRISKSSIRAPFNGYVGLRAASPGAYVSSGDIISTLVETNPAKVDFSVPEKYAGGIRKGMEINFEVSGLEREFKGKIYAWDPMIDASSRALRVRALSDNSENRLVPGAFVKISLDLETIQNALMIPTLAVVPLMNSQNVYLIKNGMAKLQDIDTGIRDERMIQVTNGLRSGDTLAVTGLLALRNGIRVNVSKVVTE
jgi:membrane fusion protein (multidrug efflux system)